jgi:hypothetical protein
VIASSGRIYEQDKTLSHEQTKIEAWTGMTRIQGYLLMVVSGITSSLLPEYSYHSNEHKVVAAPIIIGSIRG